MTPAEYIAKKKIYAVALTTEQVDRLSREFREKAAWIVGQDEAHIIDSYYRAAERIASGELTAAEARRMVREALAEAGYQAENPGSWGDLKDGTARQKLILETNVNKAAGYAYYTSMQGSDAYPAQRLVRMGHRKQPRDWQARWMQAYASLPPEEQAKALPTQMVALMDCKIWEALSRWGDPYPPFDYGSGMDVDAVDYDTAARLGLVPKLEDEAVLNRAEDCHSDDPAHCRVHGTPEKKSTWDTGVFSSAQKRQAIAAFAKERKAKVAELREKIGGTLESPIPGIPAVKVTGSGVKEMLNDKAIWSSMALGASVDVHLEAVENTREFVKTSTPGKPVPTTAPSDPVKEKIYLDKKFTAKDGNTYTARYMVRVFKQSGMDPDIYFMNCRK
ncbi:MAG: hypothetical protein J1E42_06595 [Akkermansiaceae bacterium]|nr:hypothetical protein [Akkermansiaceae bacterium]